MAQRVGIEHADEHGEFAFTVETTEVLGGIGNADLVGEVADHRADDLITHFLLVPGFVDKAGSRTVRGIGAIPQLRPAENSQGGARQPALTGLDQVELAAAVLVGFVASTAKAQGDGDMAVEREHMFMQGVGLFDDLGGVSGLCAEVQVARSGAHGHCQGKRQADVQGFAGTGFGLGHCHLNAGLIGTACPAHRCALGKAWVSGGRMRWG
ncbi:hypothetical protein D3C81_1182110 [compost metagenome]